MTNVKLTNKLSLEASLRDGYRDGKWYKQNLDGRNTYCFAFRPNGPALEIAMSDEFFAEPLHQGENISVEYHPKYDSVSLLDRDIGRLRRDAPSRGYFKRLGYLNSNWKAKAYYFSTPIRVPIGACLDSLLLISIFGMGCIKGWDWVEDYIIAGHMADIGKDIRQIKLIQKTLNSDYWIGVLIKQKKIM